MLAMIIGSLILVGTLLPTSAGGSGGTEGAQPAPAGDRPMVLSEGPKTMHVIKLELFPPGNTLNHARRIPGLGGLTVDEGYGLVPISPKRGLYVIRVLGDIDVDEIRALPQVKGVYGEIRIAPTDRGKTHSED